MNNIYLFGAFDRYNYGDNLMPILFLKYLENNCPELFEKFGVKFVSLTESNLENYKCLKTGALSDAISNICSSDVIVVVGGEVLPAYLSTLFIHIQKGFLPSLIFSSLLKISSKLVKPFAKIKFGGLCEFPYILDGNLFPSGCPKIIYNTIGGKIDYLSSDEREDVISRLSNSRYLSVRDRRTFESIEEISNVKLYPDSVIAVRNLVDDEFLSSHINNQIGDTDFTNTIVIQLAPGKLGCSNDDAVNFINKIGKSYGKKLILLPIGYASGHDDYYLLRYIYTKLNVDADLLYDLNIWEIMYVIKNCNMFVGTSLHGVITSMSFGVPHFGINPEIPKLNSFLNSWSIPPFNEVYTLEDFSENIFEFGKEVAKDLEQLSIELSDLAMENYSNIVKEINSNFHI